MTKDTKKYHKVRDHDHYPGKFRGAAHSICNLRFKTLLFKKSYSRNSYNISQWLKL